MKKKKHWNSFTTPFFVHPETVERQLKDSESIATCVSKVPLVDLESLQCSSTHAIADGFVNVDKEAAEALLKRQLVCHRCKEPQANIPALKVHIANCAVATACVGDDNVSIEGGTNSQGDAPPRNKRGRF